MKQTLALIALFMFLVVTLLAQEMQPPLHPKKPMTVNPRGLHRIIPTRDAPTFTFTKTPTTLLSSYWDYQIGGYSSLPVRVQPSNQGNGVYMAFTGSRTANGTRRVFYSYLDANDNPSITSEITSTDIREGYVSCDVDRVSGIPFFAWHSNIVTPTDNDAELEVTLVWDMFLESTPGWLSTAMIPINNPSTITTPGITTTDNEFIWPYVHVGPSPLAGHRRVYVVGCNSVTHTAVGVQLDNLRIAYADFTTEMLQTDTALVWSYTTVPELDAWNHDTANFRRPFFTYFPTEDGRFILAGYHFAETTAGNVIDEPTIDVFINNSYGVGNWTRYSADLTQQVVNPVTPGGQGYFEDADGTPYPYMHISVSEGGHTTATLDRMGLLHFPLQFAVMDPYDSLYYPYTEYLKDVQFNTNTHAFHVRDLYPQDLNPNDDQMALPWNLDGQGPIFDPGTTAGTYDLRMSAEWNYMYWDDTADGGNMKFDYNIYKFTKMNEQGMMAAVWSNSLRAKLYHEDPTGNPDLAPYGNTPEIFISIYPQNSNNGHVWSEPIMLNSIDYPAFRNGGNNIIPEWPNPGDYIRATGSSPNASGKLYLMSYDDNSWGSAAIDPPTGSNSGGRVMYTVMDINWGVGNDDHTIPASIEMLRQNYPNPFNPSTTITFALPQAGNVSLKVYNMKGQVVKTLVNENRPAGSHDVEWDGVDDNNHNVASGMYFYTLQFGDHKETKKMMLIK